MTYLIQVMNDICDSSQEKWDLSQDGGAEFQKNEYIHDSSKK